MLVASVAQQVQDQAGCRHCENDKAHGQPVVSLLQAI